MMRASTLRRPSASHGAAVCVELRGGRLALGHGGCGWRARGELPCQLTRTKISQACRPPFGSPSGHPSTAQGGAVGEGSCLANPQHQSLGACAFWAWPTVEPLRAQLGAPRLG